MHPNKKKKLVQTLLGLILLLTILNVSTPLIYATEWSPDTRLTWDDSLDWAPSIAQAQDGKIWVVWHSYRTDNADIFYKVYDSSQVHPWSPEKRLTTDPDADISPSIMQAKDGKLWVVWSTNRSGNYDIYYKTSTDNGETWSPEPPSNLTADPDVDEFPSIMQDKDGDIWVVWSSDRTGNFEIYYKIYNYTEKEWHPEEPLISNPATDEDPSIIQAQDDTIWIAWTRDNDLFYKVLFENKTEVEPDTKLTDDEIYPHPSIMQAQDGKIWIAWESNRPDLEIYCKIFYGSWSEERITYNYAGDLMPAIMQATDGKIWIAWTSTRLNNFDIYYKTDSPPQPHDVAIISVTPSEATVNQDQTVSIEVVPQNHGTNPETFNVTAYANSTLINGPKTINLSPGQLHPITFLWDTSSTAPGTYKIWAKASAVTNETYTVDNTFPAILGDVNGDRTVNASDLSDFTEAYGSEPGDSNWNPNCNLNRDNKVEASDLFDLSKNYGTTI